MTRRTPIGTWAIASLSAAAVAGSLTTLAPAAVANAPAPAALPIADILDVDFRDGTAVDHARAQTPKLFGDPEIVSDMDRVRAVMAFDGDDAASYSMASQYAAMVGGFAVECSFRYDGTAISGSEQDVCGSKEAGGMATYVSNGKLGFMAHIGGGYKSLTTPIVANKWYHSVVVWDGAKLTLYVDGVQVGQVNAPGAFKEPSAGAHNFVLGGDAQPSNGVGFHAASAVQTARVYSSALTAEEVGALATAATTAPTAPDADILDVDFTDGTAKDQAQDLPATTWGDPVIRDDAPLNRKIADLDGSSAWSYPLEAQYPALGDGFAVECVFKYDDELAASGEERGNLCAGKEAGGFSMTLYGNKLGFNPHIGGSYRNVQVEVEADRWYHVVGSWDGDVVRLFLNGVPVREVPATGALQMPTAGARNFVVGGDASTNNRAAYFAPASIAAARLYSEPVELNDVLAMQHAVLADGLATAPLQVTDSVPAAGSRIDRAVQFELDTSMPEAVGRTVEYRLDGTAIEPGDVIGAGLKAGDHEITMTGKDVFGRPISQSIAFTSGNVPSGGGTETDQANGSVTLSSVASNPGGGDVRTTFVKADVKVAGNGFQGTVKQIPTTFEFDHAQGGELTGAMRPDGELVTTPSATGIAFQRHDVAVAGADGQRVVWTGQVDPTRSVVLRAWNGSAWEALDSARGAADGSITLSATARARHHHQGAVPIMVTGEDPFADDLPNKVAPSFEDPDDYDFSLAHLTDTQYLSEGAVEQETQAERDVWERAYSATTKWIADNADERKIAFTAHTGDIIENWHNVGSDRPNAQREFEVASKAQKNIEDAGLVNTVLPGNHDNLYGVDTGPDALYNDYFGPERYEAQAQGAKWTASQATYQAWKPGDNSNNYVLFSAGGLDFVVVSLGFGVDGEETDWANDVLEQYADRNAIVLTHAYTTPSANPDGRGGGMSWDGYRVRDGVIKQNPNVFLVLSGHEHGVNIEVRKDLGEKGNHVVELLADYQFYKVGSDELGLTQVGGYGSNTQLQFGAAFFRLLQFDVDRAEMSVDTYSPMLENFGATEYDDRKRYNGTEDDFRMPIQLQSRATSFGTDALVVLDPTDEVIGTDTARSGWPASVTWSDLSVGDTYAWQAISTDAASGEELPGQVTQLAMFTAEESGVADNQVPVIGLPAIDTVEYGATFDPRAGVTATDNRDGDLLADLAVHGSVDTTKPGRYQLVYTVTDAAGNQALASRDVRVQAAPAPVNTQLPSILGKAAVGQTLNLSIGEWSNADVAEFHVQWLRNGAPIAGATGGDYRVTSADAGARISARVIARVAGNDPVVAAAPSLQAGKLSASAAVKLKKEIKAGKRATVTATFSAAGVRPTGTVVVKVDGRTVDAVTLTAAAKGKVSVKLPKLSKGKHKVTVTLLGNAEFAQSSGQASIKVRR